MNEYIFKLSQELDCDENALKAIAKFLDKEHIDIRNVEIKYDGDFKIKGKNDWIELDVVSDDDFKDRIADNLSIDPDLETSIIAKGIDENTKEIIKEGELEARSNYILENAKEYFDELVTEDEVISYIVLNTSSYDEGDIVEFLEEHDMDVDEDMVDNLNRIQEYMLENVEECFDLKELIDEDKLMEYVESKYVEEDAINTWIENASKDDLQTYVDWDLVADEAISWGEPERFMNAYGSVHESDGYLVACPVNINEVKISFKEETSLADRLAQSRNLKSNDTKEKSGPIKDKERE